MDVRVYAEPALLKAGCLEGTCAVVIDVLRMTSVAATAIENGCAGLLAVAEPEAARAIARERQALLGGERQALPLEGFDFGNSPLAYTRNRVSGRRLVMTTSNGTRAILAAEGARRLVLGGFVNATAVARALLEEGRVAILCAGTLGAFTLEDAMAAGAILDRLERSGVGPVPDDMGRAALMLYRGARGDLAGALRGAGHVETLRSLGMQDDIAYCLSEDLLQAVPERGADGWFA